MQITDVSVTPLGFNRLKGKATLVIDGQFVVRGVKIVVGKSGQLLVAMPSRRLDDGSFEDVCHPILPEFRNYLENLVLDEYHRALAREAEAARSEESLDPGSKDSR